MINKLKTLLSLFLILLIIFTILSLLAKTVQADTILFQDDFNDNTIGSIWEVKNYDLTGDGSFGDEHPLTIIEEGGILKISGQGSSDDDWFGRSLITKDPIYFTDKIQAVTELKIPSQVNGSVVHLTIEFDANNRIIASLGQIIENTIKAAHLSFEENSIVRTNFPETLFEYDSNTLLRLRLIFDPQTRVTSFYIGEKLIDEDVYHSDVINDPHVGIAAAVRDELSSIDAWFDNFKVTSSGEPDSNLLNVPDIKQYDPDWGTQEYDHANNWYPSNPTISRWGCAMTSATMVLNYHGGDTNPEALNNWLKANNGYSRNGAVLWPSVSRYSLLDPDIPTLEFAYLDYSDNLARSELEGNRPPILKLLNETYGGNHFIAARGTNNSDILINDPGTASNNTLAEANTYWGDTLKLGRFKPSETDLSYIVLFIDEDFEIKVSSESGEITNPEYYLKEYPMLDPDDPSNSSDVETLNAFYYPKPESGIYQIQVSGEGNYQLDIYVYNNEGNVNFASFNNSATIGEENNYLLNFDKENSDNSDLLEVNFVGVLSYWESLKEEGKITNHGLYTSIKRLIENALKNKDKGDGFATKVLLEAVLQKVRFATPQFITEDASMYFQNQIEILLSDF